MKKILFITGTMKRGGAERVISILANRLLSEGFEIHILTVLSNEINYILNKNVIVHDISSTNKSCIGKIQIFKNIRKSVQSIRPDLVISFMVRVNIATIFALKNMNIPIILSERNDPSYGRSIFLKILSCYAYSHSTLNVMQTKKAFMFFSKRIQNKSVIIGNPIEFSGIVRTSIDKRIVNVARLEKQKNQKLLIDAYSLIADEFPEYILEIYGEGSLRNELENQIKTYKLENKVFLRGNVLDVKERIVNADLFVMTSIYEGMSNALLEAMSLGIPCITTGVNGVEDLIVNNANGVVLKSYDKYELASEMKALIQDDFRKQQFSLNSVYVNEDYSIDTIIKKWIFAINKAIGEVNI